MNKDKLRGTVLEIDLNGASNFLEIVLHKGPVKFIRAYTVDDGIKLASTKQPDLIFVNPFMPVISGFEVYEILQSNPNTKHIPVIFYGSRIPDIETKVKESGVPYIFHPFDIDELFKCLATYLTLVEE